MVSSLSISNDRIFRFESLPCFTEFATIIEALTGHAPRIYANEASQKNNDLVYDFYNDCAIPARQGVALALEPGCLQGVRHNGNQHGVPYHSQEGSEYLAPIRVGDQCLGFVRSGLFQRLRYSEESAFNPIRALTQAVEACARALERSIVEVGIVSSEPAPPVVQHIAEFIEQHSRTPLFLKDVARATRLSPSYVTELLKKHYGLGFRSYLTEIRLNHAINLLKATPRPISEIAFEVGFQSLSHFNNAFRRKTGLNPTSFRRF